VTDDGYIHPLVKLDPIELADAVNAAVVANVPGWRAIPYSLEGRLVAGLTSEFATGLQVLTSVGSAITAAQGRLARIEQRTALPATSTVTVRAVDDAGYVLAAGAGMQGVAADGTVVPLDLTEDAVIPHGQTSVSGVQVQVAVEGEVGNGITGAVSPDGALVWLDAITLDEPTAQGVDEEDDDDFEDRLARRLTLLADAQIYPDNIEQLVLDVPGVGRACVLNLVDPANPSVDTAGHITICPANDVDGGPIGTGPRNELALLLARVRVLNNVNHIVDPTMNALTVALTVAAWPEKLDDAADQARGEILAWLSPRTWGMPQYDGDGSEWRLARHVRIAELVAKVSRADAVAYPDLSTVRINGSAVDVEMTGLVPLPTIAPDDIDITVVERTP
jgi:hypothetical protein